ncbi:MAG: hypothetical protein OEW16_05340 [Gammaproteobacteria bacterium]|nr:hypothetical protein [Gammaproteobacteria bacterium]
MSSFRIIAAALLVAALFSAPALAARIPGHFTNGVYKNPQKVFTVCSPLGKIVYGKDEPVHNDSWRGMAVVAHDQRFYLLMTELRVEALATPDWKYDADAADWNQFLPELEDLTSASIS